MLSGHGPATTIGRERATNPYLAEAAAEPKGRGALMTDLTAPKGTYDRSRRTPTRFLAVRDALTAPLREGRLRLRRDAGVRGDVELFSRGVGESTDIVTKEMYTFDDQGRPTR